MVLEAQGCEPKCTEVGVVTTDQLMHSLDEDAFTNIHQRLGRGRMAGYRANLGSKTGSRSASPSMA